MSQPQGSGDGWRGPGHHLPNHGDASSQPPLGRAFGSFASNMQPQGAPPPVAAPVLPPPSYHHQVSSGGHNLPTLADLTQGAPSGHHQPSPYNTHPPPNNPGHSLPGLGPTIPHQSPQAYSNRDREHQEIREREMHDIRERGIREREREREREQEHLQMQRRQEAMLMQEQRERQEHMERLQREQQQQQQQQQHQQHQPQQTSHHTVQSHTGSIPLHQPVASKVGNSIHGPNGLLSNIGSGPGMTNPNPLSSSVGGNSMFQVPPQSEAGPRASMSMFPHSNVGQLPAPQPLPAFMGQVPGPGPGPGPGPSPMPAPATLGQGQQPILNDALSYLDQVKVRFSDHPDVYNRFLDIMKDFKSQAIDTPGVIDRVSNLFNGHPSLIQGFNTFLPPGYRIECGTDDNPDAIRVTTPSGTMTQSLQSRGRGPFESSNLNPMGQPPLTRQDTFDGRPSWGQQQQSTQFSPRARPGTLPMYGSQSQLQTESSFDQDATNAALVHQQDQRGVSQLQNAVSAATNGNVGRPTSIMQISPGPGQPATLAQHGGLGSIPSQQVDPKRGPVEFNHAISYVNKIKNRFAQQPEIYKQFLEILQTYQRESKPIQDVYSQVTHLFSTAPDLLEDFKQFLPESAAQAKAQAAARAAAEEGMTSNLRGDSGYGAGQIVQVQTPRPAAKMPPMGQFDPPSTSKENKKRRGGPGAQSSVQASASLDGIGGAQGNRLGVQLGNVAKRTKITHPRAIPPIEAPLVSPTLVPQLPEPLPPLPSMPTTQEELGFFDRAKKHIANKSSYAEFLKLMNLFSQDLIDKHVLLDRVTAFLGNNPDLMAWFTKFLGVSDHEEVVEARIRPDPGRVNLSHCRALGPSYRQLPKRDQNKLCKGRDGMCYEVLNDVWASHPTWASEDSGFIAHRKNQYEEGLHRLEEERHDYDFHIESCQRTIQLMEPIVQQINLMSEADRANFVLAPGLGGQSEAIPKRIIMKIYDRERGAKIMQDMFARPTAVLPVILNRLKQKLEEWKQSQREWEKVWRDQTSKFFWKSLDHQGINAKNLDKKNFQQKTLTSEIQAKYEERKKSRDAGYGMPKHQLEYAFHDKSVILDAAHLVLVSLESEKGTYNGGEQERIASFMSDFVPSFFDIDRGQFKEYMSDIQAPDTNGGDVEDGVASDDNLASKNPIFNIRKSDFLRRGVLDRLNGREGSGFSGSKESTPAAAGTSDPDEAVGAAEAMETEDEMEDRRWISYAPPTTSAIRRVPDVDELYPHTTFNLYCNANIYCFFRLFETLCSRLLAIQQNEGAVHESVARSMGSADQPKPAIGLKMIDKLPGDFFYDISPTADYYRQINQMCEEILAGRLELNHLEETLRRYYMHTGWQLYTIDKLLSAISRFIMSILASDAKDKSTDIINLFFKDRERNETSRELELVYRKQVQKMIKEGETYKITYDPSNTKTTIRVFPSEEATFDSDMLSDDARWQYYVASYTMSEPTEGVDLKRMSFPFLKRNVTPPNPDVDEAYAEVYGKIQHDDSQAVAISPDTYKIHYSATFMMYRPPSGKVHGRAVASARVRERFVGQASWMIMAGDEEVARRTRGWETGLKQGFGELAEDLAQAATDGVQAAAV